MGTFKRFENINSEKINIMPNRRYFTIENNQYNLWVLI